jgi:DedD protein
MAERSNASSKKNQDAAQDVTTLQKRGRRRLVGAIALVLLAVIVLPMVFDPEPKPNTPTVNIRIPSEEGTKFTPKAAPKSPLQTEARKPEEKATEPAPTPVAEPPKPAAEPPKPEDKPAAKPAEKAPVPKPVPKPAEKKVAAAPAAIGEQFVVQVGAFASSDKVKEITDQLKEARLAHYTESVATAKGSVTRVRLGPFASKEAAEKARERAKALGLNPANAVAK